jgi:ABC-type sugar transport system substrate-binding protein
MYILSCYANTDDYIPAAAALQALLHPRCCTGLSEGIPVIVLDQRVLDNQYTCFIGADNKKIGRATGKWIAGLYPTGGKEAVEIALDILNDKKVPKEITLSSRVFTRYNINQSGELLSQ